MEALSQLIGRVGHINFDNVGGKGKNRAEERYDEFSRHMGLAPLFPFMREMPGFLLAIVKRIDNSDLEMGSTRLACSARGRPHLANDLDTCTVLSWSIVSLGQPCQTKSSGTSCRSWGRPRSEMS